MTTLIKPLLAALLCIAFTSCGIYEYRAEYIINEPYAKTKEIFSEYYSNEKKSFSMFQDRITSDEISNATNTETYFRLMKWAPDIGTQKLHESRLTPISANISRFIVAIPPNHRWGSSPESRLEEIDSWITTNLQLRSKTANRYMPESGIKSDAWYRDNRLED